MTGQIPVSRKNKTSITNLPSAKLAQRVINVKIPFTVAVDDTLNFLIIFSEKK